LTKKLHIRIRIHNRLATGGILTLALALGKTTRECQALYFRLKDQVFVGKRPYEVGPLEALLKKEFGEDTTMGKLPPTPRILVTGERFKGTVSRGGFGF
jgi:calcium-independent phospholipase A2